MLQAGTLGCMVLLQPPDQNALCLAVYLLWQILVASTPGPPSLL